MPIRTPLLAMIAIGGPLLTSAYAQQFAHPAAPSVQQEALRANEAATDWIPTTQSHYIAPYAGHANHAHFSPTFRWGWFGAEHYYPRVQWHKNYVGDRLRWSTQRRY